jgi:hypothetical protein
MGRSRPLVLVATLVAVSAGALASVARTASRECGPPGYAYAGLVSPVRAYGISGTIASAAGPLVEGGHVAGWIGVGAPGEGPHGSDEWLQVGLNTIAGSPGKLYYETAGLTGIRYVELASSIPAGRSYRLAVLEVTTHPDTWRVWVDGRPAGPPIRLPESHGTLTAMAMAERFDGGLPACDRYEYRFGGLSLVRAPGGAWSRLRLAAGRLVRDSGTRLVPAPGGFVAGAALSARR